MNPKLLKAKITQIASQSPAIEVVWLYGSVARGDVGESSDIDIACALNFELSQEDEIEEFRYLLQQQFERPLSVVNINRAPIPLAINIIDDGMVVYCTSELRLHAEESRIWSIWEDVAKEAKRFPCEL